MLTALEERFAYGRSLRPSLRRRDQGNWAAAPERPDPVEMVLEHNAGRLPALVPIKMGRMAASPFGFFRGAAPLMAADLAPLPRSGLRVEICGDAHVLNLGAYATPEGHLVFDINDFDETTPGPWEWDLKRMAASLVLAGREAGSRDALCQGAVRAFVSSYRTAMRRFAAMKVLKLARYQITREVRAGPVHEALARAARATHRQVLEKLTVPAAGGWRRFAERKPLLQNVSEKVAGNVLAALGPYRETLGPDHQQILDAYRPAAVAFKVVGTGSVGTRDYVVLCFGNGVDDPLFLQVKEALPSCYAPYLPDVPPFAHQGRRVAEGQHRLQTISDPFLGWTSMDGRDYLVRQLNDHKAGINPGHLKKNALVEYADVCGKIFAKAHARTGDAAAIAGYCGNGPMLDKALARFALAYAAQTASDHARFVRAVRAGRVKAIFNV